MKYFILNIFILLTSEAVLAGTITGLVTDLDENPLPFATVFVKGTSHGTATNPEGYFEIELENGEYDLVFQYVGFKKHTLSVLVTNEPLVLKVTLFPDQIELSEVVISADAEDPAYRIIRNAIAKRKYHLDQVKDYICNAYTKGIFRMTEAPDIMFGDTLNSENDSIIGIFYLSESESVISFQAPGKMKEEMISSKVSGDDRGFSFNFISFFLMNFYKAKIAIPIDRSDRGFISPIANNALFYYKYQLEGTFMDGDYRVNKIRVIPKRNIDPVFSGHIYIIEELWSIHSLDLLIGKDAQIDFIDSIRISKSRIPLSDTLWMGLSQKLQFYFSLNFLGKKFKGNGVFHSQFTDYAFHNNFEQGYFNNEIIRIDPGANQKDSAYWEDSRPIPLTGEEVRNYHKEDSIAEANRIKQDTTPSKWPKPKWSMLMDGYSYYSKKDSIRYSINSPLSTIQFNTVQGWNFHFDLGFSKRFRNNHRLSINQKIGYGFSDKTWFYDLRTGYNYNRDRFARIALHAGTKPVQYNSSNPISPLLNTLYTLLAEYNYMKLYRKNYIYASHFSELTNGVYLHINVEYADRHALVNSTSQKWVNKDNRDYTSNNPQEPLDDTPAFERNQAFIFGTTLRLVPWQKYISIPEKQVLGSKWPTISLTYKKAIKNIFGSDMDWDYIEAMLEGRIRYGLLGEGSYMAKYGSFLNDNTMEFMDWHHFNGNRTIVAKNGLSDYSLLDYYEYSTDQSFVEAAYEHHFNGFIFNKLPLIRKLKWRAVAGARFFSPTVTQRYTEVNVGIENIFKFLRCDFVVSFESGEKVRTGVVFRLYM